MCQEFNKESHEFDSWKISYSDIENIESIPLEILNTASYMLPDGSTNEKHKDFFLKAISSFANVMQDEDRKNRHRTHGAVSKFSKKLAYYILKLPKNEIEIYLKSLIEKFNSSEDFASLLEEISVAEDVLGEYENFWHIWFLLYERIKNIVNTKNTYRNKKIITGYLLSNNLMCLGDAKNWHSLKKENMKFYYNVVKDMGQSEYP